ncbi:MULTISPECIES: PseG/SpsG family protein [unclassified Adlercreutzia]|uniref:PseG/SpsG family protein n=1 Tax=unclassified Adlercreutzia TaxID=2636013 RepID=UPI0013EB8ADA|nr:MULTISPECIES: UDP-2,4-diacetamido-2,4,6-trideoxy-beta-L-altropyranose hydrolase [unclassified Adlercreutzia]
MIVFRADANEVISAGHVMRCLAIAEAASDRGVECIFVSADDRASAFASAEGFRCKVLGTDWRDVMSEVPAFGRVLDSVPNPLVIVDTYQANERYVRELAPFARVGYLGTKVVPGVDFLVNYSLSARRSTYDALPSFDRAKLMIGPMFAPLGSGFSRGCIRVSERVRSILLTTGNTDPVGVMEPIVRKLAPMACDEGFSIKAVVGPLFDRQRVGLEESACGLPIEFCRDVKDMGSLMRSVDLAVSACGTTLYELAACGVPTVGFSLSPEQDSGGEAAALGERGLIEYAGRAYEDRERCAATVGELVNSLVGDRRRRAELSSSFHGLVDGRGCERICDEFQREGWL